MVSYANTPYARLDLEALALRAEKIYNEKYRIEFEKKYWGQYAFIDPKSGKAYIGKTEEAAREKADADRHHGMLVPFGIGFDASDRLLTLFRHD